MKKIQTKMMLSFDLEIWHEGVSLQEYLPPNKEALADNFPESVLPLLDLLSKYQSKATFFATGKVIKKYPEIVRKISDLGHEIGSHTQSHNLLSELTPEQFEKEIKSSIDLIKDITGKTPKGFRAPNLSLNQKTRWALPILAKLGFKYDSSIFPFKSFGAPNKIYKISFKNPLKEDPNSPLLEISLPCYSFLGIPFPIAGSVYFRVLPFFLFEKMLKEVQKKRTPILYFHPWELYKDTPVVKKLPWFKKFTRYYGTGDSLRKFERLLKVFQFDSIENVLKI